MKVKNSIINYFAILPYLKGEKPRVFKSPMTLNHEVAKIVIRKQLGKTDEEDKLRKDPLLHVCYDLDSQRLYSPNAHLFDEKHYQYLLAATKARIKHDYGEINKGKVIPGSPFSSIRLRKIESFDNVKASLDKSFSELEFRNLNVVEASLDRMPYTREQLPPAYAEGSTLIGGLIDTDAGDQIRFLDQKNLDGSNRKEPIPLLAVKTPFILIDTSPRLDIQTHDKEWTVLTAYQKFVKESLQEDDITSRYGDLYSVKNLLYLGFPLEQICDLLMGSVRSFGSFVEASNLILQTVDAAIEDGMKNPIEYSYYMSFKVPMNKFPLNLNSILKDDKVIDSAKQLPYLRVIEYNTETENIIIETPLYVNENYCSRIFRAEGDIVITKYNPAVDKIDVKSDGKVFKQVAKNSPQAAKLKALNTFDVHKADPERKENQEKIDFRSDERSRQVNIAGDNKCHLRKVSDYNYATEYIQRMCDENNVPFQDFSVLIGPIERIFGSGTKGGFMGEALWKKNEFESPHEIEPGLFVNYPIIFIDSADSQSYAAQGSTLIHEYSHYIYSIVNPEHEHEYLKDENKKEQQNQTDKFWFLYYGDPDERLAHIKQIVFELKSGYSADEIVRNKMGGKKGQINADNYAKARLFREIVDEAIKIIENEEEFKLENPELAEEILDDATNANESVESNEATQDDK